MNYTEKYHLPQWKKEDRIFMDDFNNAMASIEKGLAAADRAGFLADEMSRDLYRQIVHSRVHHCPCGRTDAMWVNALASLEDAGGEGHGWDGRYGVYHGDGGLPTMEGVLALEPKEEGKINTVAAAPNYFERAAVTFTSDGYGLLDQARIFLRRGYDLLLPDYTITMTRLDTNEVVAVYEQLAADLADDVYIFWQPLHFPLEPHVSYRMELQIVNRNGFRGWGGFMLATTEYIDYTPSLRFAAREAEPSISKTVEPPERATGAIGMIRWQGDGTAVLAVNGQTALAVRTRDSMNAKGTACKETEFLLEAIPQEAFELTLEMEQGEGDLDVYDYGLIWR